MLTIMKNVGRTALRADKAIPLLALIMAAGLTTPATAGVVKVCKVAGDGVNAGDQFDFTATNEPGDSTPVNNFSIPAGPAPGGYCWFGGQYEDGFETVITEVGPVGHVVTDIIVAPSDRQGGVLDLNAKEVSVIAGPGITEVTFVNERRSGFLEICKTGGVPGQPYHFDIYDMAGSLIRNQIIVPSGACSPAEELPAGQLQIREVLPAAAVITQDGCRTIPADRQIDCDQNTNSSTIEIVPGDISTQTIAFIENETSAAPGPDRDFELSDTVDRENDAEIEFDIKPVNSNSALNNSRNNSADRNAAFIDDPASAVAYDFKALAMVQRRNDPPTSQSMLSCSSDASFSHDLILCTAEITRIGSHHLPTGMVSFTLAGETIAALPVNLNGKATLALPTTRYGDDTTTLSAFFNVNTDRSSSYPPVSDIDLVDEIFDRLVAPFDPNHYAPGEYAPSDNDADDLNANQLGVFD